MTPYCATGGRQAALVADVIAVEEPRRRVVRGELVPLRPRDAVAASGLRAVDVHAYEKARAGQNDCEFLHDSTLLEWRESST